MAYQSQGKFAESELLAHEASETDRTKRPDSWQRFREESLLGASLAGQKKFAEAGTSAARRLSRHGRPKGTDASSEPLLPGPRS